MRKLPHLEIRSDTDRVADAEILLDGVPIEEVIPGVHRLVLDMEAGGRIVAHVEFWVGSLEVSTPAHTAASSR